ncbi:hypothetical protein LSAT2_029757, partial [Lamellibrachia satsuma]
VVVNNLALAEVTLASFLTRKYALWLDLRTTDHDQLHGTCRAECLNIDPEVQCACEGPQRTDLVEGFVSLQRQRLVRGRPPRERCGSVAGGEGRGLPAVG